MGMGMKAYVSTTMGVPGKPLGTIFTPVEVQITCYTPERVGLDFISQAKHNTKRTVTMSSDLQQVTVACQKLLNLLKTVQDYDEDTLSGKIPAENNVGRHLTTLISSIPKIDPEKFQEMHDNMKDLLMVVYLSNL